MSDRAKAVIMNALLPATWTADRFLAWAGAQNGRYEFDGMQPVAMTGGSARHNRITNNIQSALRARLRTSGCVPFGPDLGLRTPEGIIRYPDALITCTPFPDTDLLAPDPVVVFEVLSPSSGRVDRIEKVREYASVASIRRYVVIESSFTGVLVLHRAPATEPWTALTLSNEDTLDIPEVSVTIPISELYDGVMFEADTATR